MCGLRFASYEKKTLVHASSDSPPPRTACLTRMGPWGGAGEGAGCVTEASCKTALGYKWNPLTTACAAAPRCAAHLINTLTVQEDGNIIPHLLSVALRVQLRKWFILSFVSYMYTGTEYRLQLFKKLTAAWRLVLLFFRKN